jgi:BirA family biotin operon repressor/biotin-[acetyl-CoA-carboxylase] ligase
VLKASPNKLAILDKLVSAAPEMVPSGELVANLKVTRQAIWKGIESLREETIGIESVPNRGYRFSFPPTFDLSPTWLEHILGGCLLGHPILVFDSVDSTQEIAKEAARQNIPAGLVVLAEEQRAGRGRMGRTWLSPTGGNLYASILLRPRISPMQIQLVNLAAGLAVQLTLESLFRVRCSLKWPNDLLWKGRKLCGILSETASETDRVHYAVTGIGLNVNMSVAELLSAGADNPCSLIEIRGEKSNRGEILAGILLRLAEMIGSLEKETGGVHRLVDLYRQRCSTLGKEVRVLTDAGTDYGIAENITQDGALEVNVQGSIRVYTAADVLHVRACQD